MFSVADTYVHFPEPPDEASVRDEALKANGGPPTGEQTFIYFIQSAPGMPVKIGHARHPFSRRMQLQIGNWQRLYIVGLIVVQDRSDENGFHRLFADYRLGGEWFRAHPALVGFTMYGVAESALVGETLVCPPERQACWPSFESAVGMTQAEWDAMVAESKRAQEQWALEHPRIDQAPTYIERSELLTYRPDPDEDGWGAGGIDWDADADAA